jgi:hypothetical protein
MSPEMMPHRFPPPWSVEETPACFIVRDHGGQALAYVPITRPSPAGDRPREAAHARRGAAAGGQLRAAAGFAPQSRGLFCRTAWMYGTNARNRALKLPGALLHSVH